MSILVLLQSKVQSCLKVPRTGTRAATTWIGLVQYFCVFPRDISTCFTMEDSRRRCRSYAPATSIEQSLLPFPIPELLSDRQRISCVPQISSTTACETFGSICSFRSRSTILLVYVCSCYVPHESENRKETILCRLTGRWYLRLHVSRSSDSRESRRFQLHRSLVQTKGIGGGVGSKSEDECVLWRGKGA